MSDIELTLNEDENLILARIVLGRLKVLEIQPRSPERDTEVRILGSIIQKVSPQTSENANIAKMRRQQG